MNCQEAFGKRPSKLTKITFIKCKINWQLIPQRFHQDSRIYYSFINCYIKDVREMVEQLSQIENLYSLNLTKNKINKANMMTIEQKYLNGVFPNLREIYLGNNEVKKEEVLRMWEPHKGKVNIF